MAPQLVHRRIRHQAAGCSAGAAAAVLVHRGGRCCPDRLELTARLPAGGVKDYDVVYFDQDDLTPDGEQAVEAKVAELLDFTVPVPYSVSSQHLDVR
jgi:hypothetical protein